MKVREYIKDNVLLFDGAMGTMLQKKGLKLGGIPELLNLTDRELIKEIHREYLHSGSQVITTNTFGANEHKLAGSGASVEEVISAAVQIAKEAKAGYDDAFIALDIGPIGELLEPLGTLEFDDAYAIFKRQIDAGVKAGGVDIILIETMTDLYEVKAAVLAAKESCELPVFVTMSFEENGRTFTGCCVESMVATLSGLGVDALGVNCSLGPMQLKPVVSKILKYSSVPVMVQPNAGLPVIIDGKTNFDIDKHQFSEIVLEFVKAGVSIVGGCCGTSQEYIDEIKNGLRTVEKGRNNPVKTSAVCTPSQLIELDSVKVIGERINPTGKKIFKQALVEHNMEYILKQAVEQTDAGADILDVNVGLPEINEKEMMVKVVKEIQSILPVPLQIDSSNPQAIEAGLRYYNGKAIVNSVNGEEKVLKNILPIVKKYGAAVVGLTLSEEGIPPKAEQRFAIAKKIYETALSYGIAKENIFIDCLTLTVSAQQEEVAETLKAVRMVKEQLGLKTVLGVSNISFGLPNRALINETFLSLALANGLDLPIINPNAQGMMGVISSYKVLYNLDKNANQYIEKYADMKVRTEKPSSSVKDLKTVVIKGLKDEARQETIKMLENMDEMIIVNEYLIPALDIVGLKYEKGEIFLPQLIQSAETVKVAFEVIKEKIQQKGTIGISKGKVILATVKGDIHDIGKNIVKVIMENYGFEIIDLGRDVPAKKIVETAQKEKVKLIGLSALMTTTLVSMEETIQALKKSGLDCRTFVGGAVLTEDYAMKIGADYYAKDAKRSVDIANEFFNQ